MKLSSLPIADFFTVLNGVFGMIAIFMLFSKREEIAFILILFAVLADGMDGIIARKYGNPGGYMDELADVISFCIAPSVMIYVLSYSHILIRVIICSIYLICGLIHLIRYHLGEKEYFVGITTPTAALFVMLLLFLSSPQWILYSATIIVSILMISTILYPRIKGGFAAVAASLIILAAFMGKTYDGLALVLLLAGVIIYISFGPYYLKAKFSKQKMHT